MGQLGTLIRNAVAPVARTLVADVGRSTVRLVRAEKTRTAAGDEKRNWQTVFGASAVSVALVQPSRASVEREWGTDEVVAVVMLITDTVVLEKNDGIIVLNGDQAGRHFRVMEWRPSAYAGLNRVALQTTQERFD